MLSIIDGAPEERRRYLNLALAQAQAGFPEVLAHYARTLSQRNALLKQIGEAGGDAEQLAYWDEELAASGAHIIYARIQAVQELERLAARIHHELTRGGEILRLEYQPAYDPLPQPRGQYALPLDAPVSRSGLSVEHIRQGFRQGLKAQRAEEIARGMTTIGPHRDEVRFLESGVDLGTYGSRGQVRTAMLALKLAEAAWIRARTGQAPVTMNSMPVTKLTAPNAIISTAKPTRGSERCGVITAEKIVGSRSSRLAAVMPASISA